MRPLDHRAKSSQMINTPIKQFAASMGFLKRPKREDPKMGITPPDAAECSGLDSRVL